MSFRSRPVTGGNRRDGLRHDAGEVSHDAGEVRLCNDTGPEEESHTLCAGAAGREQQPPAEAEESHTLCAEAGAAGPQQPPAEAGAAGPQQPEPEQAPQPQGPEAEAAEEPRPPDGQESTPHSPDSQYRLPNGLPCHHRVCDVFHEPEVPPERSAEFRRSNQSGKFFCSLFSLLSVGVFILQNIRFSIL